MPAKEKRRFIVAEEFLPKGAKYDCEQDAGNLEEAHCKTHDNDDWTLDDDLELETYASQMDLICRKDKDNGRNSKSPANLKLYLNLNEGPQYITRAALLFLTTIYPTCPQLAAFQRAVDDYGFAAPNPEGFYRSVSGSASRAAPEGWSSDEKLTKHYSDAVNNARKSSSSAKDSPMRKTSTRASEERKSAPSSSVEPHTTATFQLPPLGNEEGQAITDKDARINHTVVASTKEIRDSDEEMDEAPVSPQKRGRPEESPPKRFADVNAGGTPSPEKRRRMPESRDASPEKLPRLDLFGNKNKSEATSTANVNDGKLPAMPDLGNNSSNPLPKINVLPDLNGNHNYNNRQTTPTQATAGPRINDTPKRLPSFKIGDDKPTVTTELPDLCLLDQVHARKRDAHDAEMRKLTENIKQLTVREKLAAEELQETKRAVERMCDEITTHVDGRLKSAMSDTKECIEVLEGKSDGVVDELSEVKDRLGKLEAYIVDMVGRLAAAGSLTVKNT